jgi:hypothetical protein
LATKIFEIFFKILGLFLKIFHSCSTPSRAATADNQSYLVFSS